MRQLIPIRFTAGLRCDGFQLVEQGTVVALVADRECTVVIDTTDPLEYHVVGEPIDLDEGDAG